MTSPAAPRTFEHDRVTPGELARVTLVMILAAIAWTYPLVAEMKSGLPNGAGDQLLNAFILGWDADRILHGLKGLWDAPFYFPRHDTLAYSEHLLGIAFFTAPVQWLTGNAVLTYNVAHIGSFVLAAVGMYLLSRSLWGARGAAWVSALAFACAPNRSAQIPHLQVLFSGWMPIGLWGLHQYFRSRSRGALAVFAGAFVLQALSNGYFLYYFAVPVVLVVAAETGRSLIAWRREAIDWRRPLAGRLLDLSVAAVAILAALAPVAAAYVRVRERTGLRRVVPEMVGYSAVLGDYLTRPWLLWAWDRVLKVGGPERELFPGVLVVVLSVIALATTWRRQPSAAAPPDPSGRRFYVWLYAVMLVLAVWLSLGPGSIGPYRLMLAVMPGLDGLRVPTRVAAVVSLALAVLAGAATAWLCARLRSRAALAVAALLAVTVAVEGYPGPMPTAYFDAAQVGRRSLNAWIGQNTSGGVLELPIADGNGGPFTLRYQFNTLMHGRPIVNGYSGHGYLLQSFLAGPPSPLRELAQITPMVTALRRIGIRTLVLHTSAYEQWMNYEPSPIIALIDEETSQVVESRAFPQARVWRLADLDPLPIFKAQSWTRVDATRLAATASPAGEKARRMMDDDPRTAWDSGIPQRGDEWIRIGLDRERDLVALQMELPSGRLGDYPRVLRIEAEADDGSRAEVFSGPVLPYVMTSIVRTPQRPSVTITLPPNRTRALLLHQFGQTRHSHWTVVDVALWERRPARP